MIIESWQHWIHDRLCRVERDRADHQTRIAPTDRSLAPVRPSGMSNMLNTS